MKPESGPFFTMESARLRVVPWRKLRITQRAAYLTRTTHIITIAHRPNARKAINPTLMNKVSTNPVARLALDLQNCHGFAGSSQDSRSHTGTSMRRSSIFAGYVLIIITETRMRDRNAIRDGTKIFAEPFPTIFIARGSLKIVIPSTMDCCRRLSFVIFFFHDVDRRGDKFQRMQRLSDGQVAEFDAARSSGRNGPRLRDIAPGAGRRSAGRGHLRS